VSALPQPTLKLDQYGRNPDSPAEKLRRRTNYSKGTGWAPFFLALMADLPRLSSGQACDYLILAILTESLGRVKDQDQPHSEWTEGRELEYWASLCRCDIRTVQRERDYLVSRKIAEVQVDTKRRYSFRLRFREWQALEDYSSWKAKQKPVEPEAEPEPEDPTPDVRIVAGTVRLLKAPVAVKGGKTSRAWPINCGVKSFQVCNPNSLDLRYDAVVQAGRLLITPQVLERRSKGESVEKAKTVANKGTSLNRGRHGCHPDAFSSPPKRGVSGTGRTQGEHPRSEELSALFDPLLLRSCHKSLSADRVALSEACEAVGQCDHDWLVKYVIDRFERPVKSPRYARLICREANQNWEKHLEGMKREAKRAACPGCGSEDQGGMRINGYCSACAEKKRTRLA
jgi:hypothetical protein